jgi:hypothetical protein
MTTEQTSNPLQEKETNDSTFKARMSSLTWQRPSHMRGKGGPSGLGTATVSAAADKRHKREIRMLKNVVRLPAMLLLVWFPCAGQFDARSAKGVVTDQRGNTLRGAAVQLENMVTLSIVSYITGKDGGFQFNLLNDDTDYTLKAKYRRYWSRPKTLSKFNSSRHPEVDLIIPIE